MNVTILPTIMKLGVIINLLIWVGLSSSPYIWLGAAPVQASNSVRSAVQSAQDSNSLEPGKPIQRELSGGQTHYYKITITSEQFLHIVVKQQGIDVAVALMAPDDKKISEADSDHLIEGLETVSAIMEVPGAYIIEVHSPEKTAKAGRYEINVEELRAATAEDKYRVAGELIFREAERLQNGTLEAKRKSIEKYYDALEMSRKAGVRSREAIILSNIGTVYWSLGEMQKALEKYNEALSIFQAVGNRRGEAQTLSNISVVHRTLGEMHKALEKLNEALPLWRAVGARGGEAESLNNIGLVYRSLGEMQKALDKYNEALPLWRAAGNRKGEATTLNNIGVVYRSLGEMQKALDKYNEALPILQAVGDRSVEAITLNNIGLAYWSLGEMRKALDKYNEALPIGRAIGDRRG